jgi:hypothetical protein
VVAPDRERDGEQHDDGEVERHVSEPSPEGPRAAGDRQQVEHGGGDGAEDAEW